MGKWGKGGIFARFGDGRVEVHGFPCLSVATDEAG